MHLKRWDAVEWLELPRIEHPTHARYILEGELNLNGFGVCWIEGLNDVLWSDTQWTRNGMLDRDSHAALMRRVAQGEVFLVYDIGHEPAFPLLRRSKEENSDKWTVNDGTLDYSVRDRVDWMISRAVETKGSWAPIIVPKAKSPPPTPSQNEPGKLTVKNPRWEHADQSAANDRSSWACDSDTVVLKVDVTNVSDGARVGFKIFDTSISPPRRIGTTNGVVKDGIGTADWIVKTPYGIDDNKNLTVEFEGEVRRVVSERGELKVDGIEPEIILHDSVGSGSSVLKNIEWKLIRSGTLIDEGTTGDDGKLMLNKKLRAEADYELTYLGKTVVVKTRTKQRMEAADTTKGLQQRLAMLGYNCGPDHGHHEGRTLSALKGYRIDNALGDGEHDDTLTDALKKEIGV